MNIGEVITRNAKLYPEKIACAGEGKKLTFKEFNKRVNRFIHALNALGVKKGDRIAVLSKSCTEYMEAYGVAQKGGKILVPLNSRFVGRELIYVLNNCGANTLMVGEDFLEVLKSIRPQIPSVKNYLYLGEDFPKGFINYEEFLQSYSEKEPFVNIKEDDVAYIIYTSGTTGFPKGATVIHGAQIAHAKAVLIEFGLKQSDRYLNVMPLYHVGGAAIPFVHFYRGSTTYLLDKFEPKAVLETIEKEKITTIQLVPSMINFLLDYEEFSEYDLKSLRFVFYVGSPMPVAILKKAIAAFRCSFIQGYGQTESGPAVTFLLPEDHIPEGSEKELKRLASCGKPIIDCDVKLIQENGNEAGSGGVGEIVVKSPYIMKGYWNDPERSAETIKDGWLYTGDMATVDEDGYFYIVDRKKDMIISGGENIYPREVEEVLYSHPSILEATVIGVPDEKWGESVKALVVLKKGEKATEEELIEYCKMNLASYKKPKSIDFVDFLPKTPSGKILKKELREQYWKGYERKI